MSAWSTSTRWFLATLLGFVLVSNSGCPWDDDDEECPFRDRYETPVSRAEAFEQPRA